MSSSCWLMFASSRELAPELAERLHSSPYAVEIGVGKVRAAATTARILARRSPGDPSTVFLFGVAGAYREAGIEVGELRIVTTSESIDEGVELADLSFRSLEKLGFESDAAHGTGQPAGYDQEWCGRVASHGQVARARAATVSTCSGHEDLAVRRFASHGLELETMESAAVAFACAEAGVRLCELRCVSNLCGERSMAEWDLPRAVAVLSNSVSKLIDRDVLL